MVFAFFPVLVMAQGSPQQAVRWIVPYPAGGGTDTIARIIATEMSKRLQRTVIIDNKSGASTIIGAQDLAASKPDGNTVMSADSGTLAYNSALYPKLPYDPQRSFTYIGGIVSMPMLLVARSNFPLGSLQALIDDAAKNPGKYTYASAGNGSPQHLAMEMFQQKAGIQLTHIPYRGVAPALQDLIGKQVDLMMIGLPGGQAQIRAGSIKALGTASAERLPELPSVPALRETAGLADFRADSWSGLVAPAGLSQAASQHLEQILEQVLAIPEVRDKLIGLGAFPMPMASEEFRKYAADERAQWAQVINSADIKLN